MDEVEIQQYFENKRRSYSQLNHAAIVNMLYHKEYVEIEDLKEVLFEKRLDYFSLAHQSKESMLLQTGYKQLNRYFVNEIGLSVVAAKSVADKLLRVSKFDTPRRCMFTCCKLKKLHCSEIQKQYKKLCKS